ncbi:MAG: Ig-like domain-containing protein [Candidatus Sulfotelmatobacter sp.]|jgi:hypothetical protein
MNSGLRFVRALSHTKMSWLVLAVTLTAIGCSSGNHLESIQVYPADSTVADNTTVYLPSGGTVQYQVVGWFSDRTSQTINPGSVTWSSSNTSIATISSSGLATSVGPAGVTQIIATVSGQSSRTELSVQ